MNTKWTTALCTGALIMGFSLSATAKKRKPTWDKDGAKQLEAMHKKMNDAWAAGDHKAIRAMMADKVSIWDLDMKGKPSSETDPDKVAMTAKQMHEGMKMMGAKMEMTSTSLECHASGLLGVCLSSGTATMTMGKMPPVTTHWRATSTAVMTDDGWRFAHHHSSFAKAAPMPTQFSSYNGKSGKWMTPPDSKGLKMQPIWSNSNTHSMAALAKFTRGEFNQPRHFHPANVTVAILKGQIKHTQPDGKVVILNAGDVFFQPANEIHMTLATKNSIVFVVTDGQMATIKVDKAGKPIKSAKAE